MHGWGPTEGCSSRSKPDNGNNNVMTNGRTQQSLMQIGMLGCSNKSSGRKDRTSEVYTESVTFNDIQKNLNPLPS